MQSVSSIGKRLIVAFLSLLSFVIETKGQDNSPWSRYGLGDMVPSAAVTNRGMGHVAAAYSDFQTINFVNPASYAQIGSKRAVLDIGLDINSRTLRNNRGASFNSKNAYIPYLAGGFQIKPEKSKTSWGMAFGLRPLTKVNYNIQSGGKMASGDSLMSYYEGNGGSYQAFLGTAIGRKNFSIGINGGYRFGTKDYTTRVEIYNDTAFDRYTSGKKEIRNNFGSMFVELGMQYVIPLSKKSNLNLGAYGSLRSSLRTNRSENYQSYTLSNDLLTELRLDSVYESGAIKGNIQYPSYFGVGFLFDTEGKGRLNIGADYVRYNWADYRYFNEKDLMQNSWQVHVGTQYLPDVKGVSRNYWSQVLFRAGVHLQREPFTVMGNLKSYGFTIGAGLPIRKYSYAEMNRSNVVNTALEIGQRSDRTSLLRENYFRFTVGFSLSDIWFIKRKYD